jgi:hypothetical protein
VNDVIVKVDDDDVQGQPLSTLRSAKICKHVTNDSLLTHIVLPNRNLILGKQGTYVVLAFRRMTVSRLCGFSVVYLDWF